MKSKHRVGTQTFLDKAISWLSPGLGRRRMQERMFLDFIQQRNYSAGDMGRRTDGWNIRRGQSANSVIAKSLPIMRERSRDLVRNNPWGASIRSEIVANLVHYGITASFSRPGSKPGKDDEDVPPLWLEWAESFQCDAARRKNFYDIQKLVANTWVESGECFIRRVWRPDWRPGEIPFALQVLEPEFLDHSHDGTDSTKLGIKFGDNGSVLGYWTFRQHPGEAVQNESFFVPVTEMIHVYSEDRPGQIRGVPLMAPVTLRMYDLDLFEQAELQKQEIAAMFAGFEKTQDGYMGNSGDGGLEENPSEGIDRIEPGAVQRLGPGKDIVFANPPQRTGYAEYVKQNLLAVAAGVGLTYEGISGDYGKVTFLNGRMGQLRFHRKIDQWQWMMFIPQFCDGVARWFKEGALIAGQDLSKTIIEWQPPVKQMVDPAVESQVDENSVRMGSCTQFEIIRSHGKDPIRFLKDRKRELEIMDEMGLVFTTDPRKISGAGQMQNGTGGKQTIGGSSDENGDDGAENSEEK